MEITYALTCNTANRNTIRLYFCVLIMITNLSVYAASTLETKNKTVATFGVPTTTTQQQSRTGKCRKGSFFTSNGLERYFECCETELNPLECIAECPCFNNAYCDITTRRCRCPAGKAGQYCRVGCSNGHYGIECVEECTCGKEASCDSVSGLCTCPVENKDCKKCRDGLYGPTCKIPCFCGAGQVCDADGKCLKGSGKSSSHLEIAVALGVILGILLILVFIVIFIYFLKKREEKRRSDYVGVSSSGELPFDIGIGRDSVDLLESPVQAPRSLTGLMRFLNNKQEGYARQTSGMENRQLPKVPEVDEEHAFLAADGTEHAKIEPEPISPTLDSAKSFDAPCSPDLEDNAPRHSPPPPPVTPVTNQINPPHIIINHSPERSRHGTPASSPSGSLLSIHSTGQQFTSPQNLPVTRQHRSASSPSEMPSFRSNNKSSNYDQLDRKARRSFATTHSSPCDSGSEYDKLHVKLQHRKSHSKSSLKRKRHGFEKQSRTEESDTESDYPSPTSHSPRNQIGVKTTSETSSSSDSSDRPLTSGGQQPDIGNKSKGSAYVRLPANPVLTTSGSPRSTSPTSNNESDLADPYLITDLKHWRPKSDEEYRLSNSVVGANKSSKHRKNDYETPDVGYAKPKKKKNRGAADNGNISDNSDKGSNNNPDMQPESTETNSSPNHDYFVLNINNSAESTSTRDGNSEDDVNTGENVVNNIGMHSNKRADDYEIPMGEFKKPPERIHDDADIDAEGAAADQRSFDGSESESTANARTRVDDYETPIEALRKPPERMQDSDSDTAHAESREVGVDSRTRVDDYETPMLDLTKPPSAE